MAKIPLQLGKKTRSCVGCTKCCEGWLTAKIDGEDMFPGKPCQFVKQGVGCTIYENRPEKLCETFECSWKASDFVPVEFSPVNTGQIISSQVVDGIPYMLISYAGKEIDSKFLSWVVSHAVGNQLNVTWSVNDEPYLLGSPEFIEAKTRQNSVLLEERKRQQKYLKSNKDKK